MNYNSTPTITTNRKKNILQIFYLWTHNGINDYNYKHILKKLL